MDWLMDFKELLLSLANIGVLIGSIAGLIAAVSYLIRTRGQVSLMRTEIETLKAQSEADDQEAENEQQAKIISIMERQTEYSHETATRFATIAEDFATYQNRSIEVNASVAHGLTEMAKENKALRISVEQWPSAIDGKLEAVDDTLGNLVKKVSAVETAITTGNSEHTEIKAILRDEVLSGIEKIVAIISQPPPPSGDKQPSAASKTTALTMADAAQNDATVDGEQKIA